MPLRIQELLEKAASTEIDLDLLELEPAEENDVVAGPMSEDALRLMTCRDQIGAEIRAKILAHMEVCTHTLDDDCKAMHAEVGQLQRDGEILNDLLWHELKSQYPMPEEIGSMKVCEGGQVVHVPKTEDEDEGMPSSIGAILAAAILADGDSPFGGNGPFFGMPEQL